MTQEDLAALAGLSTATIKKFENRQENWAPSRKTLEKLSLAFGLNESHLSDILDGREPKIPASRPEAKRKPEDYLEEILGRITTVEERLTSMDTVLGQLATRADIAYPDK